MHVTTNVDSLDLLKKGTLLDAFIIPMIPHEASDKKNVMKLNYLSELSESSHPAASTWMKLLVTCDCARNLHITVNGLFPILKYNVSTVLEPFGFTPVTAVETLFVNDLSEFHIIFEAGKT